MFVRFGGRRKRGPSSPADTPPSAPRGRRASSATLQSPFSPEIPACSFPLMDPYYSATAVYFYSALDTISNVHSANSNKRIANIIAALLRSAYSAGVVATPNTSIGKKTVKVMQPTSIEWLRVPACCFIDGKVELGIHLLILQRRRK